jgi:hypothetical protein
MRCRLASAAGTENGWPNGQRTRNVRASVKNGFGFLVSIAAAFIVGIPRATAEGATSQNPDLPPLYIGTFKPVEEAPEGFGPLHALNSDLRHMKSSENAARLSSALIAALVKHGARAQKLPTDATLRPQSGWIIQGLFYASDQNSRLISVPFLSKQRGPNVEVSVTVADSAKNPDAPFAVIGNDAIFMGQGTAVSWNPYVAAAKFVVHQVQGQDSLQLLADQIAQKILDERQNLLMHDAPTAEHDKRCISPSSPRRTIEGTACWSSTVQGKAKRRPAGIAIARRSFRAAGTPATR